MSQMITQTYMCIICWTGTWGHKLDFHSESHLNRQWDAHSDMHSDEHPNSHVTCCALTSGSFAWTELGWSPSGFRRLVLALLWCTRSNTILLWLSIALQISQLVPTGISYSNLLQLGVMQNLWSLAPEGRSIVTGSQRWFVRHLWFFLQKSKTRRKEGGKATWCVRAEVVCTWYFTILLSHNTGGYTQPAKTKVHGSSWLTQGYFSHRQRQAQCIQYSFQVGFFIELNQWIGCLSRWATLVVRKKNLCIFSCICKSKQKAKAKKTTYLTE